MFRGTQITKKCTQLKCKRMPLNLSLSFMPKEKPKSLTSSVSGCVGKLQLVNRFCPQLVRINIFLSVDKTVSLFCCRRLLKDVHLVRNTTSMGLQLWMGMCWGQNCATWMGTESSGLAHPYLAASTLPIEGIVTFSSKCYSFSSKQAYLQASHCTV